MILQLALFSFIQITELILISLGHIHFITVFGSKRLCCAYFRIVSGQWWRNMFFSKKLTFCHVNFTKVCENEAVFLNFTLTAVFDLFIYLHNFCLFISSLINICIFCRLIIILLPRLIGEGHTSTPATQRGE